MGREEKEVQSMPDDVADLWDTAADLSHRLANLGEVDAAIAMGEAAHHLQKARASAEEALQAFHEGALHANLRWTRKYINQLPDSHFFYVDKSCATFKDAKGRSHPLTCRHLPYVNKQGYIDIPHVRNAISRAPQAYIPKTEVQKVQREARKILREANAPE